LNFAEIFNIQLSFQNVDYKVYPTRPYEFMGTELTVSRHIQSKLRKGKVQESGAKNLLIRLVLQGHPLWGYPGDHNQRGEGLDHPQSPVEEPLRGPEARVRHRETDQQENLRLGVPSARRSPRVDPRRSPQRPTGTNSRWENLRDQLVKSLCCSC
jgi:hypothetical protein